MKELTVKQKNIFGYLETCLQQQGYPPSIREIGDNFGITAKGAYDHLKAIEKKSYIKCYKNRRRAIELLKSQKIFTGPQSGIVRIPVVGHVAAGTPLVAEENIEEFINFPRSLVQGDGLFALHVTGDSMKDAGIFDKDMAILRKQDTAKNGDIVVALLEDDEATLKYFYRDTKGTIRLEPANSAYKPIYTKKMSLLGKLVGVYRSVA